MRRAGIAMVEAVMAIAVVGGLAVAAMSLVSSVAVERRVSNERSFGQLLARQLAEEIAVLPLDAAIDAGAIDSALPARTLYDDVTDYDGYTRSPPRMRDGTAVPGADGWTRSVEVTEVAPGNPEGAEVADTDVYRVRVTAEFNGRVAGEMVFYRSESGDEATR